ncbi:MAG: hypothetical protein PHU34_10935 [Candidatus Methanoperedens sp.]|nr:hypothetical protein [Candidatus Methanoperedens sp.]
MVLEAVQIFTIFGSLAGFGALYLHYKQYKKQQPIIKCYFHKSHYEILKNGLKDILKVKASFIVNNNGNSPTSVINCAGIIQIQPEFASIIGNSIVSNAVLDETLNLPCDIKANGSTKIELSFSFDIDNFLALDRCMISLNGNNIPRREYKELPLAIEFIFYHTHGTFEVRGCVFRKDQPESEKVKGEIQTLLFSAVRLRTNVKDVRVM